jgi:hypothetical protein
MDMYGVVYVKNIICVIGMIHMDRPMTMMSFGQQQLILIMFRTTNNNDVIIMSFHI